MSQLAALKAATGLHDVAKLLGYKTSALAYILYKLDDAAKYKQFEIPKRSGGKRTIKSPMPELKRLQRKFADLLEHCLSEINQANGRKDQFAHGFKKGRSIFSASSVKSVGHLRLGKLAERMVQGDFSDSEGAQAV